MLQLHAGRVLEDRRFLFCITLAAALLAFLGPLFAYDLWWHLKAGGLILSSGAVPRTDPFSFTAAGRPWTYHSWLSGLALTGVWRAGGTTGLIGLRAVLIAGSLMVGWVAARKRGVGAGLASVLVLAACLQLKLRALARPYLFSFVLFIVFALILQSCAASPLERALEQARECRRRFKRLAAESCFLWGAGGRLILLPLLTVLWANLHAGFISGMLLIGAFGVGEMVSLWVRRDGRPYGGALLREPDGARFRAMFLAGILCLPASLLTPYGPGTLLYPFRLLEGVKLVKQVQEWQPMPFGMAFAVFWGLLALGGIILVRSVYFSRKAGRLGDEIGPVVTDLLLMCGFAFLAVQAVRHMAWFLLLVPSVFGWHLAVSRRCFPQAPGEAEGGERKRYAYVAILLALVVGALPFARGGLPRTGLARDRFPVKACDYIEAKGLNYRLYNSYEWGGYLIWRLWPEMQVFIDGRCLVYGDEIIGQALQVEQGGQGWEQVLDDRDVEMFLVRYRKKDASHLFAGGRWRCVYWDDVAVIGLRDDLFKLREADLPEFALSNPVVFEQSLERERPGWIRREVGAVIERDPDCWTALAFHARCLVRLAEEVPDARGVALMTARGNAKMARDLQEGHYLPWLALYEVTTAQGDEKLAAEAAQKLEQLRPPVASPD